MEDQLVIGVLAGLVVVHFFEDDLEKPVRVVLLPVENEVGGILLTAVLLSERESPEEIMKRLQGPALGLEKGSLTLLQHEREEAEPLVHFLALVDVGVEVDEEGVGKDLAKNFAELQLDLTQLGTLQGSQDVFDEQEELGLLLLVVEFLLGIAVLLNFAVLVVGAKQSVERGGIVHV